MSALEIALARIEAILAEIEQLERETGGAYRQPSDREAYDITARIERRMRLHRTAALQELS